MQLSEKIQKIRKENNMTQEQLADKIFVSRTAVSKWETGRGISSIDSLQMIAKEFDLKLDDLLSTEEIATIAKNENRANMARFTSCIDAATSASAFLAIILPLYKAEINGGYYSTYIGNVGGWQGIAFLIIPLIISMCGILQLVFVSNENKYFKKIVTISSFSFITLAVILSILSLKPYPALYFFLLLTVKGLQLIKRQ